LVVIREMIINPSMLLNMKKKKSIFKKTIAIEKHKDDAIIAAQLYLRSTTFRLQEPLFGMGWRKGKDFYLVKSGSEKILEMCNKDPKWPCPLDNVDGQLSFVNIITNLGLMNPSIVPMKIIDYEREHSKSVIIRNFYKNGSLKDDIFNTKPKKLYDGKYVEGVNRKPKPLLENRILDYGRQILDVLYYLERSDYPFPYIHTGNIFVVDDTVFISDIENSLLGVERYNERLFRQFAKKYHKAYKKADITVLAFGATLYELITAQELKNLSQLEDKTLLERVSDELNQVLLRIFVAHKENDHKTPTIQELLETPPFSKVKPTIKDSTPFEFQGNDKDLLTILKKKY